MTRMRVAAARSPHTRRKSRSVSPFGGGVALQQPNEHRDGAPLTTLDPLRVYASNRQLPKV